jgi:hypothetical protein
MKIRYSATFVEVIEVAVRVGSLNHPEHRFDEELTIQPLRFLSWRGHGAHHTPRESALGRSSVRMPILARPLVAFLVRNSSSH